MDDRSPAPQDAHWYKDVVVYQLHVKSFFDANNDGTGDFPGLTAKLDYLRDLGVDAIWLMPFYPSPQRDDGYDIADYRGINPQYGSLTEFRTFLREAHRRGLRVITELVINHTSDQHPWFQAARRAPKGSRKRNFYLWSDDDRRFARARIIFTDIEKSNWTWDEVAKQYYWHRFFSHQPDLNFDNPQVFTEVIRVMDYWLDMGVDGLRLDAIPYLVEREGTSCENLPETHAVVKRLRAELDAKYQSRLLLAEANQWPEDVRAYFGDGDECHMAYHFPLMPRMYMAIAQEDRHPIVDIMNQTPAIPDNCQWGIFLRNHDELTLEMVTSRERDYMYQSYAADPRARLNLGIRRRLAPLMENDPARCRLMNSLLLSMPGSPILYYGDELLMGDNIYLGDRNGVRTPMQWSPDRNAGFSRADPQRLCLPPIMDSVYGFEAVNVEAQLRDSSSPLQWMRRMLAVRKTSQAFGRGRLTFVRPGNRKIIAYLREYEGETIFCVANLARTAQPVELDLTRFGGRVPVEMLGRTPFPPIGELPYLLTLPGHGFYWFKLETNADPPAWHLERLATEEPPVLVLFDGWATMDRQEMPSWKRAMADTLRATLETVALPRFLGVQRWYAGRAKTPSRARVCDSLLWGEGPQAFLLAFVEPDDAPGTRWWLPLSVGWEDDNPSRPRAPPVAAIARARYRAQLGTVIDALADESFCRRLLHAVADDERVTFAEGRMNFRATSALPTLAGPSLDNLSFRPLAVESSNTVVAFGDRLLLKAYRRMQPGVNVEAEIGEYLTTTVPLNNIARLAGRIDFELTTGESWAVAVLQEFVVNQGDGWRWACDYLQRHLEREPAASAGADAGVATGATPAQEHGGFLTQIQMLGQRTADLHAAFAVSTGRRDFDPEPITQADVHAWKEHVTEEVGRTLHRLSSRNDLPDETHKVAHDVLLLRVALEQRIRATSPGCGEGLIKSRYHGDYHLGQVLVNKDDWVIVDFEGEPERPLADRRAKHSPLRDVAGMLRSFGYVRNTALATAVSLQPQSAEPLNTAAKAWEQATAQAFLDAYRERATLTEADWAHATELIQLFLIEKAAYEVRYELDHRIDLVQVPLAALREMAAAAGGTS
jgi:maltose alpha-D-glucosyltransferase/alpha-amylase